MAVISFLCFNFDNLILESCRETMSRPPSPTPKGYFSAPFERFVRDDAFEHLSSAFTLLGSTLLFTLE